MTQYGRIRTTPSPDIRRGFNPRDYSLKEINALAEEAGVLTKNGISVFCWFASQRDADKHSSVYKYVEQVQKIAQSLQGVEMLIKVRHVQVARSFGGVRYPGFETLAFHKSFKRHPLHSIIDSWRGPDGKFHFTIERPVEPSSPYLSQFKTLLSEIGLCGESNLDKHFGFRIIRERVSQFQDDELASPAPGIVVPSEMRMVTALNVANAIEADTRWTPVNIARMSAMEKSRSDKDLVYTQSDLIRFSIERGACPDYASYNFKDRFGNPLYDPKTKLWRPITTGTVASKFVQQLYDETEAMYNGAEDRFGRGFTIIPVIHEPQSMDRETLEQLKAGGTPKNLMLTEDEAAYNEAIQLINWQNKFPDREIGEIKYIKPQKYVFHGDIDDKRPFTVSYFVFNYNNRKSKTWGETEPTKKGQPLPRTKYNDKTSLFVENFALYGGRDDIDHINRQVLRIPQMANAKGRGRCAAYSILVPENHRHIVTKLMPQYLLQLVNWNIRYSTGRENVHITKEGKEVPRFQMTKFDLATVLVPWELYGSKSNTLGSSKRIRMIAQFHFLDKEIEAGRRKPPSEIKIPARWAKGEYGYDILKPLPEIDDSKSQCSVKYDDTTGLWSYDYRAPNARLFELRRKKAAEAWNGIDSGKYRVFMRPRVYARDRDLMHIFEWYFRWSDEINDITEYQGNGFKNADTSHYIAWEKPLMLIDEERPGEGTSRLGDSDVCFETGQTTILLATDERQALQGSVLTDLVNRIEDTLRTNNRQLGQNLREEILSLLSSDIRDPSSFASDAKLILQLSILATERKLDSKGTEAELLGRAADLLSDLYFKC